MSTLPLIGLPSDIKTTNGLNYHSVGDKYLRAVATASGALPVSLPAFGEGGLDRADAILDRLDGLLLTGSPSNVHPTRYDQAPSEKAEPYDEARDELTMPLTRRAIARGIPVFAICRGMQELNVALGGSLHPRVHELPGRLDHRRPRHEHLDVQYGIRHALALRRQGALARLLGAEMAQANSLHWQALDRVADGLAVEAHAPDETVEAVSMPDAPGWLLAVQWHPEYKVMENPISVRLFEDFGRATRVYAAETRR